MVYLQLLALFTCICVTRSVEIVRNHTIVSFDFTTTIQDVYGKASEFGLSLAMVKQNGKGWAFIGAPNAATQSKFGSRLGKVWRCSLDNKPSCIEINYAEHLCTNETGNDSLAQGTVCEKMRLGGTVLATENLVIACAPRWSRLRGSPSNTVQRMDGACLWTSTNESLEDKFTIPERQGSHLKPFSDASYSIPGNQLTKPNNISRWFYAEFGFSTHMSRNERFVSGTPGILIDQGGVILSPIIPNKAQWEWKMYHFERLKPGSSNLIRGYMGYAVTSGFYFEKEKEMIVASSPRAQGQGRRNSTEENLLGAVVMMQNESSHPSEDLVHVKPKENDTYSWKPDVVLAGPTFASYFGAALESVDINKDNLDDLLVGAPFQDGAADDNGDFTKANTGCVYIYSQKGVKLNANTWNYSKRLCESSDAFARFGTTIAKLGDIDYDGYNDFAVGAPYDDNGKGAVYIYFGQEDLTMEFKFIKLTGKPNEFNGFGHSITGNVDVDGNDTPDFVVGSYLTQQVTLFRTRPKLEVEMTLKFHSKDRTETPFKLRLQDESFSIEYCIEIKMITRQPKGIIRTSPIEIWNQLTLDEKFSRFHISNEKDFELNVQKDESKVCKNVTVTRSKKADLENDEDVLLTARVSYNKTFASHPVVNITADTDGKVIMQLPESPEYCSDCPFRMTRLFKGLQYNVSFAMDCKARWESGGLPTCRPVLNLTMRVTSADNECVFGLIDKQTIPKKNHNQRKDFKVSISVRNDNQTAINPELRFRWNWETKNDTALAMESPSFFRTRKEIKECGTSELCELIKNKLRKNQQRTVDYTLNFDKVVALTRKPATLSLRAEVYLQNDTSFPAVGSYSKVNVVYDASVSVRSSEMEISLPLSAPKTLSANFKLEIKGDTPVKAKVFVGLPVTLSRGSNPEKLIHVDSAKGWSCTPETQWPVKSRQKLQSLQVESAKARVTCFVDRASCIYFVCTKSITRSVDVISRGTVRSVALVFNFNVTEANALRMKSILESIGRPLELAGFAYANIFEDDSPIDSDHSVALFKMTIKPADTQKLAAWIIIVAAGCGLIVVSCLIFGLFRCGFFKRKAREDLVRLKAEAEVEEAEAACTAQNPPKSSGASENIEGNVGNAAENHKSDG